MDQNFGSVIAILKKEGVANEDISKFVENLSGILSQQLYLILVDQLTEEDFKELEAIVDEEQKKLRMQTIFESRSGKKLQDVSDECVKTYVQEFLAGYDAQKVG